MEPPDPGTGTGPSGWSVERGGCPPASRFWEVALGGEWGADERAHVETCAACQAAERALLASFPPRGGVRSFPGPEPGEGAEAASLDPGGSSDVTAHPVTRPGAAETRDDPLNATTTPLDHVTDLPAWARHAPGAPRPPDRVGDYEILDELGRGGMGIVYRALDTSLGRQVALKVIRHRGFLDGASMDRFFRAARLWARLEHPGVATIYHVGEFEGTPFVVSKVLEGTDLGTLCKARGTLPPREAARLVAGVADALDFAHGRGVVHRDVKPSNVIVEPDGHPVLVDFGLARSLAADDEASLTFEGQVCGTPAYMSPEQATGRLRDLGPATDIFSLGATLYALLTGGPPYRGSPTEVITQVITDLPEPPRRRNPAVPVDLETVCLKALSRDPADRYARAGEMADDLRRFLAGEHVRARRAGPAERLALSARRRPAAAGLAAAAAAAAVLAAVVAALVVRDFRRQADEEARRELRRLVNRPAEAGLSAAARGAGSAEVYLRLGDLYVNTDRLAEAAAAYAEAAARLRRAPDEPETRRDLALTLARLGEVYRTLGRRDEARAAYLDALALRRRLAADDPGSAAAREALDRALSRLNELTTDPPRGGR